MAVAVTVGFIGLGKMGARMAAHVQASGFPLVVQNRSRVAAERLEAGGAVVCASASDVVERAQVVLTCLPTVAAVESVYEELLDSGKDGLLLVDHSTVGPTLARSIATKAAAKGNAFLDAPVSGGPEGAAAGSLTVMVGGDEASFNRALPILTVFGKMVRRIGPSGSGQLMKLVNQHLTVVHAAAAAEAMALGAAMGLGLDVMQEVLSGSYGWSRMLARGLPRFEQRDFDPGSPIDLFIKDMSALSDVAGELRQPAPIQQAATALLKEASAKGFGSADISALLQLFEGPPTRMPA